VTSTLLASIALGFAVAFMHAALPTHWLPFVLVGRDRQWPARKTLGVTLMAGAGHVLVTVALGVLVLAGGLVIQPHIAAVFPYIAGGLPIALGLYYLLRHSTRARPLAGEKAPALYATDAAAVTGLVALLAVSPCEAFLPVYLAGAPHGWAGFLALSLVLTLATALGMVLFTSLSLAGADRLKLVALQGYEQAILGAALVVLGVIVLLVERA
jgi:hypothetical protein